LRELKLPSEKTHDKESQDIFSTSKTTGLAGGMHRAFKAIMLGESQDNLKSLPTATFYRAAAKAAFYFTFIILATRELVYIFLER
jgi:hypothetical protein